ncbi:hypothetical protein [Solirubrum puertoriconensis]|uniref:DUF5103 domain-containing protein n=1 Tax=Solirubrum puertoriconensis TaxID=1751427 RepID=A0A9X0L6D4_SOLP1|nr:hypothetical protein [Solirubrum puertoriconensis]KUG09590.1 hypothetical protein ASU33_17965 [Solirubrum puertoriconensis]
MKYFFLALWLSISYAAQAQKTTVATVSITLPKEIADRNNQFSGLHVRGNQLLLLAESRLQEGAEAKVYALDLGSISNQLAQKTQELTYRKYTIRNLETIRARIDSACQVYEGLEALTMLGDVAYFSIETTTPSAYCYLIKGQVDDAAATITIDTRYLVPVAKPALANNTHIHNAGFEALAAYNQNLLLLFEYNYFGHDNYGFELPQAANAADVPRYVPMARLPFRITDMVHLGRNRFAAINYFYSGDDDRVYRPASTDANIRLVQQGSTYKNYCRLITLQYKRNRITWKPLFELPAEYMTYNWEGIAAYRGGYFLINDKYGPSNQSTLLYLRP